MFVISFWVVLNHATSHKRPTTNHNHPQAPTTTHDEPQRATTSHNHPQWTTMSHNKPQQATTTHNVDIKWLQLTKWLLHSLVNALSPLNPLAGGILMIKVLVLVLQVRSTRCRFLTSGTHTMFRHYSVWWNHLEAFLYA